MSDASVGRSGLGGVRPDREAMTGANGARGGHAYQTQTSGDGASAPPDRPARSEHRDSYYGRPVIKAPVWEARDIAGYLFLGGLAGASSTVAAMAELTGRDRLAVTAKTGAACAAGLSAAALIHDLGKPSRFYNMLRVLKVTSPMSVGSWLLGAYGPASAAAAASHLTGRAPRAGRAATTSAALLGPAVAAYTAALISNTAVPAWHDGHREMPFVFVGSAAAAAGGLGLIGAPLSETTPVRRVAVLGTAVELGVSRLMQRRMGMVAEPYHEGTAGRLIKASEALGVAGSVGALALAPRSRLGGAASGLALLAASACTRFGIFYAGVQSAEDPAYTVTPQRERIDADS